MVKRASVARVASLTTMMHCAQLTLQNGRPQLGRGQASCRLKFLPSSWSTSWGTSKIMTNSKSAEKHTIMWLTLSLWEILGVVVTARDVHAASPAAAMLLNLPPSCARGFRVTASAASLLSLFLSISYILCLPPTFLRLSSYTTTAIILSMRRFRNIFCIFEHMIFIARNDQYC